MKNTELFKKQNQTQIAKDTFFQESINYLFDIAYSNTL